MGYVQRSAADEDSGGAVLFLLKAPLLHHQAERGIQTEEAERRWHGPCEQRVTEARSTSALSITYTTEISSLSTLFFFPSAIHFDQRR